MKNNNRLLHLIIGPALFLACIFFLPESTFETLASRAAIGMVAWMAWWWVAAPVDYAVTAFLPIAVNALVPMTDMSNVIANYASETILLLLGASIMTVSWEKTGLDQRIAVQFLNLIGNNMRRQVVFWYLLTAALSAVLPNAVVCATITPIAVSMLKYVGHGDIGNSREGSKILLTIAYGTGVGGLASPLGGAMNLVVVDYIQQVTGEEYMYITWVVKFIPVMILLVVSNILFLLRNVKKESELGGSKEYFARERAKMKKMSPEEKITLALFLTATVLAFTRQLYQSVLPGLKPAYAFIICAILSFLVTDREGNRLLVWSHVQTKVIWGMIYVFAGGLALGTLVNDSGAAEAVGGAVAKMGLSGGLATVFVIVTVTLLMSDVTSNTATAAITIPIVISIIQGIGKDPVPYIYIATIGVNLSYMLPTSIRAIPVGYGLKPGYMFREGWKLSVIVILLMTGISYVMLRTGFLG